ncbi:MAG: hypothetical protein MK102_10180 [Fuerstiella sp.]|nr:hypothetical protein [Fuerstiella sp.]
MTRTGLGDRGSHSVHFFGPALMRGTNAPDGLQRYVNELVECNPTLARRLGVCPKHFAYPGGKWNDETEALIVRY